MEPPPPVCGCSKATTAALEHLRGVEKQLQNEGLVFDQGTVQHLEDAIKAIKKLEEERKNLLELLEEETIKNCTLRVRIKGIPQIVMEEFEALVAAAHRSQFMKISEIEASVQEITSAVEQMYLKQRLSEERNIALCEEQKEFGGKQDDTVELLNQHMAAKHSVVIQINQLQNLEKDEEEESTWEINAIEALEKKMASEVSAFEEEQELLERRIAELQRKLKEQKFKTAQKRMNYGALCAILHALQEQVEEKNQAVIAAREELAKLFEKIKSLIQEYEDKKAEKKKILQNKAEIQNKLGNMDLDYNEQKEVLLQQLTEVEEQLKSTTRAHKKVKNENDLLRTQYEILLEEDRSFSSRRNQLAKEFDRLSNEVTENLDRLTKRLVEIQTLEEEQEKMEDMLESADSSYMRELESLDYTLQRETDRSKMLQDQLDDILAEYTKLQTSHDDFMSSTQEKTENAQRKLSNLLKQNKALEKEMWRAEAYIKILNDKLSKKTSWFNKFDAKITAELQELEDEYHAKLKLLQEKEAELAVNLPISEKLQTAFQETNVSYDSQKDFYSGLQEEETTLNKSIAYSLKEIGRLRRLKTHLKTEVDTQREEAKKQLKAFSVSLKFLERDNYEANRKLYLANAENARFRQAIAYLRAEISNLETEAEVYRSKRQQAQEDVRVLHNLFDKRWTQDKHLWELFLKVQHKVLKALKEHIVRVKGRSGVVDYVSDGLQLNYEGLVSLIMSKPSIEGRSPVPSSITL